MSASKEKQTMMRETAILSIFSVGLQGLGLLLNIFLTRRLGAVSVGIFTLMGSFFTLAAVLTGGSGFIATSRFVSEELGCNGSPRTVFRYALRFCLTLSGSACLLICLFAPWLVRLIPVAGVTTTAVRLLSLCLPLTAYCACCKGRCYAYHKVYYPALAECIEFLLRAGVLAFCVVFLLPSKRISLLTAFALSMLGGQGFSAVFLSLMRVEQTAGGTCQLRFSRFLHLILPIMANACLIALLSSANDALVPLTLLQYGDSTEQALAQFGEFEAIILPALFFPSVVQCCMSGLLVPVLSEARSAENRPAIQSLTQRVLEQTMAFSLFVVLILRLYSQTIGTLLGGDSFAGAVLRQMAPVIPFIYLEIVLEGILRGLGKQNFSSLNYLAEYTVRISVLLICVPLFGFYGIVASYIACNLTGNAVRLFFVLRLTGLRPNWNGILLRPLFALVFSWQICSILLHCFGRVQQQSLAHCILFCVMCGGMELFLLRVLRRLSERRMARPVCQPTA